MARVQGIDPREASWFIRLVYWLVQRKMGQLTGKKKLIEPIKIAAHHPRLLKALGQMEMGQEAARSVPETLKTLGSIKAATLVGCPY
jgi:4-carboxymuconolactone decarboxylase